MLYYAFPSGGQISASWLKNILRSIGAVIAGAPISILLETGTDALMHATGIFPKGDGAVAAAAGAIAMWDKMPAIGPKWYALVLIVLGLPTAWLGGKLRLMQLSGEVGG